MNLLGCAHYDPGTAVSKATTAATAMAALDTTNLRLTVTVPPSGRIFWRVDGGALHGGATFPQIQLGVMEGATVRGRKAAKVDAGNAAATSLGACSAEGMINGLTPGASIVLDAAYGVETLVASTGYKYGGPNNTTANDAFGAVTFTLWDPAPIFVPGSVPTASVNAKLDLIDDFVDTEIGALSTAIAGVQSDTDNIQTRLPAALVSGRMDSSVGAMAADVLTAAATHSDFGTEVRTGLATAADLATVDTVVDAIKVVTDRLDTAIELDGAVYRYTTNALEQSPAGAGGGLDAAGVRAAIGLASANLDTQLSGINAKTTNLPSDPADQSLIIAATDQIRTDIAAIPAAPSAASIRAEIDSNSTKLDAAISTRLASADYTAPDNAGIAAVQAKTDGLTFTIAGKLDVNVLVINGVTVTGDGSTGTPWGPA